MAYICEKGFSHIQKLPQELLLEIFSCLYPRYIHDGRFTWNTVSNFEHVQRVLGGIDYARNHDVANLRYTCKAFYVPATVLLFRNGFAELSPAVPELAQQIEDWIVRTDGKSTFAKALRRVQLNVVAGARYDDGTLARFARKEITYPEIKRIRSLLTATKKCIAKLPNLECLRVSKTGSPVSESYCSGNDKAPDYNLSLVSELRESLVLVLSTLRFEYLTDLQLNLPCTFDFHAIEKALPGRICSQLRRLYLEYSDCTGPGGSNSYLHYYDEDDDGDYYVPVSNLQNLYPNTEYMSSVTKIVSRCMNLESLGLRGTQHLQMDSLDWKPTRDGLEHIYLDRVAIGQDRLIQLLSPAESHGLEESPLFSAWLEEVHLTSGTWENVFQHLFQCPRFRYLNPQNLNYWRHGSSAEYKYYTCRPWEDCTNIWTCNEDEEDTLFQLLTKLVKKAGGLENYPNEYNELLNVENQFM